MTAYAWPFPVNRFEMRILPNTRTFTGPYTPTTQVLDLLGERWMISLDIPALHFSDQAGAAAREAFFNRLKAQANTVFLGHLKRKQPLGTLRGSVSAGWTPGAWTPGAWATGNPAVAFSIAQLANTGYLRVAAGATLLAGDYISIGGQLVQNMATTVADGTGLMFFEFQPRARQIIAAGAVVLWDSPTANFILKPGTPNVPTSWTPDSVQGATVELIETY